MGALLGQVADHRLPLDQVDHEHLGLDAAWFAEVTAMATSGAARPFSRTATPPTLSVSQSVTRARPTRRSRAATGAARTAARMIAQCGADGRHGVLCPRNGGFWRISRLERSIWSAIVSAAAERASSVPAKPTPSMA